ncbi:hypothetical protein [Otoolea muris]|uniref:hypothetical protein n=1 Tax=Otoolea muris TaxID=2941515 RepID=UPI00203B91B4|nr:hypothetical protein [Otoolea muris]
MVAEEIAIPVGVPSPVAVWLGIMMPAVTGRTAFFFAVADALFALLCGSTDRGAVPGKSQMVRVDQIFMDGKIQELLFIKPENEKKRIFRFELPAFQQRKKFGSHAGRITGSLTALLFSFRWLHFRKPVFRGEVVRTIHPNAGEEIIKSADTRGIPERESTEDGIKRSFLKHAAPDSDGSHFQFQSKQIGTQHTGREPWFRAKNRVTFLHNGIRLGKIEIPELHDIVP